MYTGPNAEFRSLRFFLDYNFFFTFPEKMLVQKSCLFLKRYDIKMEWIYVKCDTCWCRFPNFFSSSMSYSSLLHNIPHCFYLILVFWNLLQAVFSFSHMLSLISWRNQDTNLCINIPAFSSTSYCSNSEHWAQKQNQLKSSYKKDPGYYLTDRNFKLYMHLLSVF